MTRFSALHTHEVIITRVIIKQVAAVAPTTKICCFFPGDSASPHLAEQILAMVPEMEIIETIRFYIPTSDWLTWPIPSRRGSLEQIIRAENLFLLTIESDSFVMTTGRSPTHNTNDFRDADKIRWKILGWPNNDLVPVCLRNKIQLFGYWLIAFFLFLKRKL